MTMGDGGYQERCDESAGYIIWDDRYCSPVDTVFVGVEALSTYGSGHPITSAPSYASFLMGLTLCPPYLVYFSPLPSYLIYLI